MTTAFNLLPGDVNVQRHYNSLNQVQIDPQDASELNRRHHHARKSSDPRGCPSSSPTYLSHQLADKANPHHGSVSMITITAAPNPSPIPTLEPDTDSPEPRFLTSVSHFVSLGVSSGLDRACLPVTDRSRREKGQRRHGPLPVESRRQSSLGLHNLSRGILRRQSVFGKEWCSTSVCEWKPKE